MPTFRTEPAAGERKARHGTARDAIAMAGEKDSNMMKQLRVSKLVLNICVGESGDRLTRAAKVEYNSRERERERERERGSVTILSQSVVVVGDLKVC